MSQQKTETQTDKSTSVLQQMLDTQVRLDIEAGQTKTKADFRRSCDLSLWDKIGEVSSNKIVGYSVNFDRQKAVVTFRNSHIKKLFCQSKQVTPKALKELEFSVWEDVRINSLNRMILNNIDTNMLFDSLKE